jgi:hypothetical protein
VFFENIIYTTNNLQQSKDFYQAQLITTRPKHQCTPL